MINEKLPAELLGILLVGPMGTGKTSYSTIIARMLERWRASDSDRIMPMDMPIGEAKAIANFDVQETRRDCVQRVILEPKRTVNNRKIMATTMSPLDMDYPGPSTGIKEDGCLRFTKEIEDALRKYWLIIWLVRSPESIAEFHEKNPIDKINRPLLSNCFTKGDHAHKSKKSYLELAGTYSKWAHTMASVPDGPVSEIGVQNILVAIISTLYPGNLN